MQSTIGMKSIPLDMLVFDELDEASPDAKALAKERLSHSDYRRLIELSNPSLPGYGIDESYQESDQRHWTLRCPYCGEWTALDKAFPMKLGEEVRIILPREDGTYYRACPVCQAELDLARGEWVADYPDRSIHGYRIVISRSRDGKGDDPKREIVWIGTAQSYEELDDLIERFQVSRCVIDAMPEIHATREFAKRHGGTVWLLLLQRELEGLGEMGFGAAHRPNQQN